MRLFHMFDTVAMWLAPLRPYDAMRICSPSIRPCPAVRLNAADEGWRR